MNIEKCTSPIHVLSLGAGVQSSTLALMASHGLVTPMPTVAVFADTQAEPPYVYEWLAWLQLHLKFPVVRVTKGDLKTDALRLRVNRTTKAKYPERILPVFYEAHGKRQLAQRRCTSRYKIEPIQKYTHQFIKSGVVQWIGISTDEATRMKDAKLKYIRNRWPLIELGMSRNDCLNWMEQNGYPAPQKSSCIFCPFHDDRYWLFLKNSDPKSFAAAAAFDRDLREVDASHDYANFPPYLHRSLKPLDEVIFKDQTQPNMFENDCSGSCGV